MPLRDYSSNEQQRLKKIVQYYLAQTVNARTAGEKDVARDNLYHVLSEIDASIAGFAYNKDQEDTTEFLVPMLDILYGDDAPISQHARFHSLEEVYNAEAAGHTTIELAGVDGGNLSIDSALVDYQSQEDGVFEVEFQDGDSRLAFKEMVLDLSDDAQEMTIVVKRFAFDRDLQMAMKQNFAIPFENIVLPCGEERVQLEPQSFIVHYGDDIKAGHFVSIVKERLEDDSLVWVKYNDSSREIISDEEAIDEFKDAYVIKYGTSDDNILSYEESQKVPNNNDSHTLCWMNSAIAFLNSYAAFARIRDIALDDRDIALLSEIPKVVFGKELYGYYPALIDDLNQGDQQKLYDVLLGVRNFELNFLGAEDIANRDEIVSSFYQEVKLNLRDISPALLSLVVGDQCLNLGLTQLDKMLHYMDEITQDRSSLDDRAQRKFDDDESVFQTHKWGGDWGGDKTQKKVIVSDEGYEGDVEPQKRSASKQEEVKPSPSFKSASKKSLGDKMVEGSGHYHK